LINSKPTAFKELTPSKIPKASGVYVITAKQGPKEEVYYIGRSKNLRQRLYNNHLMGPLSNARLKKYLIKAGERRNPKDAKDFIKRCCFARWIEESDIKKRGAIEGYATGLLCPRYGIYEEH
jgi:hypothetical protein